MADIDAPLSWRMKQDGYLMQINQLRDENAKLRELAVLQSVIFKLRDENAELRKLTVLQSVISKHMNTCPTTDCQVCPVNEECAESVHLEGVLGIDDKETSWLVQWRNEDAADVRAENAKLRELLLDVWNDATQFDGFWDYVHDDGEIYNEDELPHYQERMRELGIEVN